MIRVARQIDAEAAVVWRLLTDPEHWPSWGPSVRAVELDGDRLDLGVTGRVQTAIGPWLSFEITEYVEGRRWSWRVAGVRATGHEVIAADRDRSQLIFEVPVWLAPYALVCRLAAKRLARCAELAGRELISPG